MSGVFVPAHQQQQQNQYAPSAYGSVPNQQFQQQSQPTSMYARFQYAQQVAATTTQTQQNGMTWNGTAWVSPVAASSITSTACGQQYSNYTFQQQQPSLQQSAQPSQPQYTNAEAYSYYYNQGVQYRSEASKHDVSEHEKNEYLRKAAWSDYYAAQVYQKMQKEGSSKPYSSQSLDDTVAPVATVTAKNDSVSVGSRTNTNVGATKHPSTFSSSLRSRTLPSSSVTVNTTSSSVPRTIAETVSVASPDRAKLSCASSPSPDARVSTTLTSAGPVKTGSSSSDVGKKNMFRAALLSANEEKAAEKKRKVIETYDSSLPENDSYYGRASVSSGVSNKKRKDTLSPKKKKVDVKELSKKWSVIKEDKKQKEKTTSPKGKGTTGFEKSASILAARASRFSGGDIGTKTKVQTKPSVGKEDNVSGAFGAYMGMNVIGGRTSSKELNEVDFERMTVKGTCTVLEKDYLRLTAPPRACMVRPQRILEKHLENLKMMCRRGERDYVWFCSQFKAIRQDLTVQRLNNDFAVEVYETHARVALENKDLNEYNQCQTQLRELYQRIEMMDDVDIKRRGLTNMHEFIAYRIIYYTFLTCNKKYGGGSSDLLNIMLSLTADQKRDRLIAHALKVRVAVADNDYHSFFRLHSSGPRMMPKLMDFMVSTIRLAALQRIAKSYRPHVEMCFVLAELGFLPGERDDGKIWMQSCGAQLSSDEKLFLTKNSTIGISALKKQNSLI